MTGDVDLNVPPPPADADKDPNDDMDLPEPPGGDDDMSPDMGEGDDDKMGGDPNEGPDDDPMPDDPNALDAGNDGGEGDEISQKYERLSSDQKHAADKYIDSMLNDDQGGDMNPPQMESRFNFKRIIDEVFGETEKNNRLRTTNRPRKYMEKSARTEDSSPFKPRAKQAK